MNNIYKYYLPNDNIVEDLLQEGYIVILEGIKEYDKNRNAHFLEFIKIKIRFFYKNYFRNTKKQRLTDSLDDKMENSHKEMFINIFSQNQILIEDSFERAEQIDSVMKCIKELKTIDQAIINLYYFKCLSMFEISNKLNISYRSAIGRKHNAINKLKKMVLKKYK